MFSLRVNAGGGSGGSGGSDKERNFATILVRKLFMLNLLKAGIKIHANFNFKLNRTKFEHFVNFRFLSHAKICYLFQNNFKQFF